MKRIRGLAASSGCVMGTARVRTSMPILVECRAVTDPGREIHRLEHARAGYRRSLRKMIQKIHPNEQEAAAILEIYEEILMDDTFFSVIATRIEAEGKNADYLLEEEKQRTLLLFRDMEDEYLQERASDIANVCNQLILRLQGRDPAPPSIPREGEETVILFADDLTPEDTMNLDRDTLGGFVTQRGGLTSHTVILARMLGIPAVVGAEGLLAQVEDGEEAIVYGDTGEVILSPGFQEVGAYEMFRRREAHLQAEYERVRRLPAKTADGIPIRVAVNCGGEDLPPADTHDGIGLLRTEFIYLNAKSYPTEAEQFHIYRRLAEQAQGREVVIRTLDVGGDKQAAYMSLKKESNPFLGYRAVRFSLDQEEIFQTQLRAVLRASVYGNVKIMFPMIVNMRELDGVRHQLDRAMEELRRDFIPFNESIPVGMMIETPAAVWLCEDFAQKVDFFSIGTNDLVQYTLATDRLNEKIQYLYDICNPAVLRSIRHVCRCGQERNIPVAMCGEAAADPLMIPLWIGLGLSELSVVSAQLARVKHTVARCRHREIHTQVDQILSLSYAREIRRALEHIAQRGESHDGI